ncbi:MAG: phosphomannomutase/phosphoglucomutase [Kiritimatiellia bacterium]
MSFFKAYDMRGIFRKDFTLDTVYAVGRWLPYILESGRILVGRDARTSSDNIFDALAQGITESGCNVDNMGLATTPMVYYFTAKKEYSGSVQITASHNPKQYNGMKVSGTGALPVGYESGLREVEKRVLSGELPPKADNPGSICPVDFLDEFIEDMRRKRPDISGLKIGVDCSNGMAALVIRDLLGSSPLYINDVIDGSFPAHAPNPLEEKNCEQLMRLVRAKKLDVGVIFDGDADRVMFVDEHGDFVQPDYLIAVLAGKYLRDEPDCKIMHDIRTSRGVIERLRNQGAETIMGRVGHAYAKVLLRESGAVCGGELAGHYYLRDFYCCDSGELAALIILGEIAAAKRKGGSFSQMIIPVSKYAGSGEMNFKVDNKDEAMRAVVEALKVFGDPVAMYDFDGYRVEFASWWLNIRKSNTEPYLRLIIEATDKAELEERKAHVENVLKEFVS